MNQLSEVRKVPLLIEVIGEPSAGKTHLSSLFSKPALFDTTPKGEGYAVLSKLYPSDWKMRYFRIREFDDFTKQLKYLKTKEGFFRTVIVDTSVDLRALGARAWLKNHTDRTNLMPEEWSWVNQRVDEFIMEITDPEKMGLNLVLTAQMQDEYVSRKTTGRRIRKGIPTMNFQADIRLFLQVTQKVDQTTMQYIDEWKRTCRVIKCRFRDQTDKADWKVMLEKLNWEGIKELSKLSNEEVVE